MHGQCVALLGLALALDGVGDLDLEVLGGDNANGARGQGGEDQGCLHGGECGLKNGARTGERKNEAKPKRVGYVDKGEKDGREEGEERRKGDADGLSHKMQC